MWSAHHQLLIVTHLPQVAAFADAHFKVAKAVDCGRTLSGVERLAKAAVERELAAMSVGDGADDKAIQAARRMVKQARAAR